VTCDFDEVTAPTAISFLNSAQNAYYEGGVVVNTGQQSVTFSSIVPEGDTQTWLIIRNPGFDGKTALPFGLRLKAMDIDLGNVPKSQILKSVDFLQDWLELGLIKTNPIDVKEGQTLTVTCNFDEVIAPTAISFINSAQNAYYEGGVVINTGQQSVTFSSIVPKGDTQTWLILRNPEFDGKTPLLLGLWLNHIFLDVEKKTDHLLFQTLENDEDLDYVMALSLQGKNEGLQPQPQDEELDYAMALSLQENNEGFQEKLEEEDPDYLLALSLQEKDEEKPIQKIGEEKKDHHIVFPIIDQKLEEDRVLRKEQDEEYAEALKEDIRRNEIEQIKKELERLEAEKAEIMNKPEVKRELFVARGLKAKEEAFAKFGLLNLEEKIDQLALQLKVRE
ncbi:MAG: hypothetical protein HYX35_03785, partial [Proteobacteria bacterium]|nr:hypothetical protein [Pseudomonadota bacterium]